MSGFSKQYCETHDMGFEGDFDIMEEFNKLEPNSYVGLICEGYGFGAIANIKGECKLLMPHNDPTGKTNGVWVEYNKVVKQ